MKLEVAGYQWAMLGLSLSYNKIDIAKEPDRVHRLATKLSQKDGGHNKFLESIKIWIDVTATRKWWSQFDTYRVDMTKQSESTMHTLLRKPLTNENFARKIKGEYLEYLNDIIVDGDLEKAKDCLPEGFLQRRICCTSYKTIKSIYWQRKSHKLPEWQEFINSVLGNIPNRGFIDGNH